MRVLWTVLISLFAAGIGAGIWTATADRDDAQDHGATEQFTPERSAEPASRRDALVEVRPGADDESDAALDSPALVNAAASTPGDSSPPVDPVSPVESVVPLDVSNPADLAAGNASTATGAPALDPATFVLRGRGTELDPFRATWDLLRSTEQTFKPAQNLREIPPAVSLLQGQIVSITGYFAAGVAEESTRELLVMFNRWDGCCLGLPPSPFDSVEVKLREPVVLRGQHMIRYGTITGRFEIEPFLVADWLIGLYRLVDAKLEWGGGPG